MKAPVFLGLYEVLEIHRDQMERYGGHPGIRDMDLLRSAVAMPGAAFGDSFLHADIHEMAAAYLFHIIRNHPFIDGNKRTGAVAALVFLMLNKIELSAGEVAFEGMVRSVSEGKTDKAGAAAFFRKHSGKHRK